MKTNRDIIYIDFLKSYYFNYNKNNNNIFKIFLNRILCPVFK